MYVHHGERGKGSIQDRGTIGQEMGADMRMASRLYPSNIEQALPAFRRLYLGARMASKLIECGVDIWSGHA